MASDGSAVRGRQVGRRQVRGRRVRRWLGRAGLVVIGLLMLDSASGLVFRTGTQAHVTVIGSDARAGSRAFVVLGGHVMSGHLVAEAFAPYLDPSDVLVGVDYAERGVDVDAIYAAVRRELDVLQPRSVVVYGASMGGMVAGQLLRRYADDGMPYGRVDLVLDTAPSSAADVRRPGWTFALSCVYRGGVLSTGVWAAFSLLAPQPDPEPGADRRSVARGRDEGAWVGMPAATSQGCFMGRTGPVAAGALDGVVARAVYLHGVPDDEDPLIDTRRAVQHWMTALPQLSEYRIATRRAAWHVPLVERPSETVAATLAALS